MAVGKGVGTLAEPVSLQQLHGARSRRVPSYGVKHDPLVANLLIEVQVFWQPSTTDMIARVIIFYGVVVWEMAFYIGRQAFNSQWLGSKFNFSHPAFPHLIIGYAWIHRDCLESIDVRD